MAVPKSMQQKYDEIAPLIIDFCDKKMNEEYKEICLRLLEKLCRKRPSPLMSGRAKTWAAGIVYAIGANNFIFDKSQEMNMTATELAEPFGIAASTASNKAAEIRKYVQMSYFTLEWVLKKITDKNLLTPMVDTITSGQAFEFLFTLDMYDFEVWRRVIVPADVKTYPLKTRLTALLPEYKRVLYTYDYGDDWRHLCEIVNVVDNYTNRFPTCVEGKGDAPS